MRFKRLAVFSYARLFFCFSRINFVRRYTNETHLRYSGQAHIRKIADLCFSADDRNYGGDITRSHHHYFSRSYDGSRGRPLRSRSRHACLHPLYQKKKSGLSGQFLYLSRRNGRSRRAELRLLGTDYRRRFCRSCLSHHRPDHQIRRLRLGKQTFTCGHHRTDRRHYRTFAFRHRYRLAHE